MFQVTFLPCALNSDNDVVQPVFKIKSGLASADLSAGPKRSMNIRAVAVAVLAWVQFRCDTVSGSQSISSSSSISANVLGGGTFNFNSHGNLGINCGCAQGICKYDSNNGFTTTTCQCYPGWYGQFCDQNTVTWSHQTNNNNNNNNNNNQQQNQLNGQSNTCGCVHGSCSWSSQNGISWETCHCLDGWKGEKCDQPVCDPNPCLNGGTCQIHHNWPHYACQCLAVTYGQHCEHESLFYTNAPTTTTTTSTTTTTTTTTPAPTTTTTKATTTLPTSYTSCDKIGTVTKLAGHQIVSDVNAHTCLSGNKTSPEAFVMNLCKVGLPTTWSPGANVYYHCADIPLYTPVASFSRDGSFDPNTAWTGIFVGCLTSGFSVRCRRRSGERCL